MTPHISSPVTAPFPQFSLSGSQGIHETTGCQHSCRNQKSLSFTRAFKSPWAKGPTLTPRDLPALSEVECKVLADVMGLLRTEKQSLPDLKVPEARSWATRQVYVATLTYHFPQKALQRNWGGPLIIQGHSSSPSPDSGSGEDCRGFQVRLLRRCIFLSFHSSCRSPS